MSRYDRPIDYGQPDYASEVDAWQALNFFGPYAPQGRDDVGEVIQQPGEWKPLIHNWAFLDPTATPEAQQRSREWRDELLACGWVERPHDNCPGCGDGERP